jgi:alpha-amylase
MPVIEQLHELIDARQRFAHGVQTLWFDHPNCIAFSRSGTDEDPGCVVVMSNGDEGEKTLTLGENYGNKRWRDFLGNREEIVETDGEGCATFTCNGEASACGCWRRCCSHLTPDGPAVARRNLSARWSAR